MEAALEGLQGKFNMATLVHRFQSINGSSYLPQPPHPSLVFLFFISYKKQIILFYFLLLFLDSRIAEPLNMGLAHTDFSPQLQSTNFSVQHILESLLPQPMNTQDCSSSLLHKQVHDFTLCCATLASAGSNSGSLLSSVPCSLSDAAKTALFQLGKALLEDSHDGLVGRMSVECFLALEPMPHVVPVLKGVIKESCVDYGDDKMFAASAKAPAGSAVLSALQIRWLVAQVEYPFPGKLCPLVIPCALTALDHWSLEVKDSAIISFIHLVKNVNVAELGSMRMLYWMPLAKKFLLLINSGTI